MATRAQLELFGGPEVARVGPAPVAEATRRLAGRMPPRVRLGTSSWSFPGWTGIVYDRRARRQALAREGLAAYARHPLLRTVGVDRSYYAPLPVEAWREYADAVPEDFLFLAKAAETCTVARFPRHRRYGLVAGEPNPRFLDAAWATDAVIGPWREGLGAKAGPLVFQFPPQDLRAAGDAARFADRLAAFLSRLPVGPLYAVEIREASWLGPRHAEALATGGAVPCFTVHPTMPDLPSQVRALGGTGRWSALVVRWMLGGEQAYEDARHRYDPFDRIVDPDPTTRGAIARLCVEAAATGRPATVAINNKAEGSAPLSALALAEAIAARG